MVSLLVTLLVLALIVGIAWWALQQIPLPQPARIIINVGIAIVAIIILASLLTGGLSIPSVRL